ncbi:hypothetical protein [Prosthecochloris sp. ZM]|nr:hypothetical protein [Prosthecochloris sp. ZM]
MSFADTARGRLYFEDTRKGAGDERKSVVFSTAGRFRRDSGAGD